MYFPIRLLLLFFFFFFFLSLFFFLSRKRNEYTRYIYEIVLDRKNVSLRMETLGLARHAAIFSSLSSYHFLFRPEREREMSHPIFLATKRRKEAESETRKFDKSLKINSYTTGWRRQIFPNFLSTFESLALVLKTRDSFFHLDPSCQKSR